MGRGALDGGDGRPGPRPGRAPRDPGGEVIAVGGFLAVERNLSPPLCVAESAPVVATGHVPAGVLTVGEERDALAEGVLAAEGGELALAEVAQLARDVTGTA